MSESVITLVVAELSTLPDGLQRQVFAFTRALKTCVPRGVPGKELLRFAGLIPTEDLEAMRGAIENGCERVDA